MHTRLDGESDQVQHVLLDGATLGDAKPSSPKQESS